AGAGAQTPPTGNGAKRFADLQELDNKLDRTISALVAAKKDGFDEGHMRRTLNDLAATKLRAVEQFPSVFGLPHAKVFEPLACMDEEFAQGQLLLTLLGKDLLLGPGPRTG